MSTAIRPTIAWSEVKGTFPRSWKRRAEVTVITTRIPPAAHRHARRVRFPVTSVGYRVQPLDDFRRRSGPGPPLGHLARRLLATAPRFVAVLVDFAQQMPQVLRIGVGPGEAGVVGALGHRRYGAAEAQGVGDPRVQELLVRPPVGGDRRQP